MVEDTNAALEAITRMIRATAVRMESERCAPGRDADRSDDYIKGSRERLATLRRIRQELEDEMARPI